MANLKDATVGSSFLLIGPAGSGKTTQFLTMPGKKFAFIFDSNAVAGLSGQDIESELFIPEVVGRALSKDGKKEVSAAGVATSVQTLERFWTFTRSGIVNGYFDPFDSILVDSMTGLSELCYDKVLAKFGKPDGELEGREYRSLSLEISNMLRQIVGLNKNLLVTCHRKNIMDASGTSLKSVEPALVGQVKQVTPTHFSNVFYTVATGSSSGVTYKFITRPNALVSEARPTLELKHLPAEYDATIKDFTKPEEYGLGKLIAEMKAKRNA